MAVVLEGREVGEELQRHEEIKGWAS